MVRSAGQALGVVLIAAAFVAQPANADDHVLHPHDEVHNWGVWGKDDEKVEYNLQEIIGEPVKIRQWVIDKLPNDSLSIDNAIMLENSEKKS